MRKYFEITGYWKDTDENFEGYVVTNYDDHEEDSEYDEDDIFMYGMEEYILKESIELKHDAVHDFVITEYQEI